MQGKRTASQDGNPAPLQRRRLNAGRRLASSGAQQRFKHRAEVLAVQCQQARDNKDKAHRHLKLDNTPGAWQSFRTFENRHINAMNGAYLLGFEWTYSVLEWLHDTKKNVAFFGPECCHKFPNSGVPAELLYSHRHLHKDATQADPCPELIEAPENHFVIDTIIMVEDGDSMIFSSPAMRCEDQRLDKFPVHMKDTGGMELMLLDNLKSDRLESQWVETPHGQLEKHPGWHVRTPDAEGQDRGYVSNVGRCLRLREISTELAKGYDAILHPVDLQDAFVRFMEMGEGCPKLPNTWFRWVDVMRETTFCFLFLAPEDNMFARLPIEIKRVIARMVRDDTYLERIKMLY